MLQVIRLGYVFLILTTILIFSNTTFADTAKTNIPILCYHNLSSIRGSMNMTPERFESQIKYLKDNGYNIIPLKEAVAYLEGKRDSLPAKPIVITADDGWKSDYVYMYPIVKKYNIPVTLFIYPQTISTGKNALTWEEVKELQQTGLFDIQGHTYSHPNFKHEKKNRTSAEFEKFVTKELSGSKKILEDKLGTSISYLAWPFGIYDPYLEQQAAKAGYEMAFTIDARVANKTHRSMAQPRFMIIDAQTMKTYMGIVGQAKSS